MVVLKPKDKDGNIKRAETLRVWLKARRYLEGDVKKNPHLLSEGTVEDLSFEGFEEQMDEIKKDLQKEQIKTRDHIRAYKNLLRQDARADLMRDLIQESVSALPKLTPESVKIYEPEEKAEAVLLFSDLHIGALVDNFFNKYNVEIARRRVREVIRQTIQYCKDTRVKKLHVLNLGDLIENDLHITARLNQEIDAVEQTMVASEIMAEALVELTNNIPVVTYRSCLDNHSRYTADIKQSKDEESLVKLIDWYLEERLKDTGLVFEHDNLDGHIGIFTLNNGEKFVFAHGHEIGVNESVQKYTAATYSYVRYIALGHWHSTRMKTFMNSKVFVNGSIKGLDEYAEKHGLFGEPEQTLLIFKGNTLVNITINLKDIN